MMETVVTQIDGREIVIKSDKNLSSHLKPFILVILAICTQNKHALMFAKLTFSFLNLSSVNKSEFGTDRNRDAFVHVPYIVKGIYGVFINQQILSQPMPYFSETVNHELAHLWHEYSSRAISRQIATAKRLLSALESAWKTSNKSPTFGWARRNLFYFYRKLFTEGFAEYCAFTYNLAINFTSKSYNEILASTQYSTKKIKKQWDASLKKLRRDDVDLTQLFEELKYHSYTIGLHMFHTILYQNKDITLEQLSAVRLSKFFKLYEDSMLKDKRKPLVSFTSGVGILDHKRMLEQLSGVYANQKTPSFLDRIFRRKR